MTETQKLFNEMMEQHTQAFEAFDAIYSQYQLNKNANQAKFNQVGEPIVDLIEKYIRRLCGKSEKTGYGKYTSTLSEKFWALVRKKYPLIDSVGLQTSS